MILSRRAMVGLGAAGMFVPRVLRGATPSGGRNFVFVHCPGGWDQTMVFCPIFNDRVSRLDGDQVAEENGITYVFSPVRPNVTAFFRQWGARTCVVNGLQVPSVAHEVCTRWLYTGDPLGQLDDWASVIAGNASGDFILPNVHLSGPLYPHRHGAATVRLGNGGQLASLLSGESFALSTVPLTAPSAGREAVEDELLASRLGRWGASVSVGRAAVLAAAEQQSVTRSRDLVPYLETLQIAGESDFEAALRVVAGCLEQGLSRSAVLGYGIDGVGKWDTHSVNQHQVDLYEELFAGLFTLCELLDAAPGRSGGTLLDDTTIVVLSEMGRTPGVNASDGKDHWTWTSAMLIGSGVRGGSTVGEWTEDVTGEAIDLETGEVNDEGATLGPAHLGATLLELADLDYAEHLTEGQGSPIRAALA